MTVVRILILTIYVCKYWPKEFKIKPVVESGQRRLYMYASSGPGTGKKNKMSYVFSQIISPHWFLGSIYLNI